MIVSTSGCAYCLNSASCCIKAWHFLEPLYATLPDSFLFGFQWNGDASVCNVCSTREALLCMDLISHLQNIRIIWHLNMGNTLWYTVLLHCEIPPSAHFMVFCFPFLGVLLMGNPRRAPDFQHNGAHVDFFSAVVTMYTSACLDSTAKSLLFHIDDMSYLWPCVMPVWHIFIKFLCSTLTSHAIHKLKGL